MLLVAGRPVSTELLEELKQMAGTCSRRQLARHLCQQMDWRSPSGARPLMTAQTSMARARAPALSPTLWAMSFFRFSAMLDLQEFQPVLESLAVQAADQFSLDGQRYLPGLLSHVSLPKRLTPGGGVAGGCAVVSSDLVLFEHSRMT